MGWEHWSQIVPVVAGGLVAIAGHWLVRHDGVAGRRSRRIRTACATIVALSEDLQQRIAEQRRPEASADVVRGWDGSAYRRARAELRDLAPAPGLSSALADVDEARIELTTLWRLARNGQPGEDGQVESAVRGHARAVALFATVAAIPVRLSWPIREGAATA